MSIHFCPHCNQQYSVGFDCTDFIHECNSGNLAIDEEDITIVGNWKDYDGEGTKSPQEVMIQGIENEFQGTRAGIEGERKHDLTRRGKTTTIHRQRQKLTYIKLK